MLIRLTHWSGPVLSLLGVLLGTWGTLLMCRAYHPFSTWKVVVHLADVMGSLLRGDTAAAAQAIKDAVNSPASTRKTNTAR